MEGKRVWVSLEANLREQIASAEGRRVEAEARCVSIASTADRQIRLAEEESHELRAAMTPGGTKLATEPTSESVDDLRGQLRKALDECAELSKGLLPVPLLDVIFSSDSTNLDQTQYSQPAIFVCSLAAMEIAKADAPEMLKKVKTAAGFSLGEYSALVFAGALSFEAGLKVVKARAEAMHDQYAGMVEILSLIHI